MKRILVLSMILIFVATSLFGSGTIVESVKIINGYTNSNGETYVTKTPSFQLKVNSSENLLVDAYLNGKLLMEKSVVLGNFTWSPFEGSIATFEINEDENWCYFIDKDGINEAYFIIYNGDSQEKSEVIQFQLDNTKPTVKLYDEDGDWILGTSPSHQLSIYAEVNDPESNINIEECSLAIYGKFGDLLKTFSGDAFTIKEKNETGFILKHDINFGLYTEDVFTQIEKLAIDYHLKAVFTIKNKCGLTKNEECTVSFDLHDPILKLKLWTLMIPVDSVCIDNDNDGKVNEDPIDGINNDGDWNDVNGNGIKDMYLYEWYEDVYNSNGDVVDLDYHSMNVLEQELIDEDHIDFEYTRCLYEVDYNSNAFFMFETYDIDEFFEYDIYEIWNPMSCIDYSSLTIYVDDQIVEPIILDTNIGWVELPKLAQGQHNISVNISDHAGRSSTIGFRAQTNHDVNLEESENLPTEFSLNQSYPNPFNPTTTISYTLAKDSNVMLTIYDALGNEIETIVNEQKTAGYHHINWDALAQPSGVYFYKLTTDGFSDMKKCILVK